ncbi:MAG: CoA transferase [Nocardioides sp.]
MRSATTPPASSCPGARPGQFSSGLPRCSTTRRWSSSSTTGSAGRGAGRRREAVGAAVMATAKSRRTDAGRASLGRGRRRTAPASPPCEDLPYPGGDRLASVGGRAMTEDEPIPRGRGSRSRPRWPTSWSSTTSRPLAGPQAAMMLGDLGARVIKVERPPPATTPPPGDCCGPRRGRTRATRDRTYSMAANRNKESIVLDLKHARRRRTARPTGSADVLLENFRVGVLDRLGFTEQRLHGSSTPGW